MRLRPATGVFLSEEPYSGVLPVAAGVEYELAVDGKLYYDKVVHAGPFNLNLEFTGLTLLTPAGESVFSGPSQIGLAATNTLPDIDGAVYELTFYALNVLTQQEMPLGTSAGPQFELVWNDPPTGYWQLQARGVSSQNRVVQSNPAIIAIRPINDSFANSIAVEGSSATWTVDFAAATRANNDPHVARQLNDDFDGNTLWWTWTAPADGTVSLHCDNWTIGFGVYTGHPGSFGMVMMPSWASGQFRAREGHTYQILLSDRYPATAPSHGTMSLNLQP